MVGWKDLLKGLVQQAVNAAIKQVSASKAKPAAKTHKPTGGAVKPTKPKRRPARPARKATGPTAKPRKPASKPRKAGGWVSKGTVGRPSGNRTHELAHDRPLPIFTYDPEPDDDADPGEVVWAWVPYQENENIGKDRPVLVVGRYNKHLLAVQLTSKDHNRDRIQENREGRYWIDIGEGAWDRNRRDSEARVDRVLIMRPGDVRRLGAKLEEPIFHSVVAEIAKHW